MICRKSTSSRNTFFLRTFLLVLLIACFAVSAVGCGDTGTTGTSSQSSGNNQQNNTSGNSSSQSSGNNQQTETPSGNEPAMVNGMRKEFVDAMDSYEAFMDEYVAFMKSYNSNPSDLSLLMQYSSIMSRYLDFCRKFEQWESDDLNDAEVLYYTEVSLRVSQKLLAVSGGIN